MKLKNKHCAALAASLLCLASGAASAASYTFVDLGTLGGTSSSAAAINNLGQVVGLSYLAGDSVYHATLWSGSTALDLGTVGGNNSYGAAINDAGQIAGTSETSVGASHATLWNGKTATDLGTLSGDGTSYGTAINQSGQVVGASNYEGHAGLNAVTWTGSQIHSLGTLPSGDYSVAASINAAGQVVGTSTYVSVIRLYDAGVIWNAGTPSKLNGLTSASGINDSGQVIGNWDPTGHAMLLSGSQAIDLGTLPDATYSSAEHINNAGQIVGSSGNRAVLWSDGTIIDLNTFLDEQTINAGWTLTNARGINENGWIVGNAFNSVTGATHAFMLSAVPEPSTFVLALAGLGLVMRMQRPRKA